MISHFFKDDKLLFWNRLAFGVKDDEGRQTVRKSFYIYNTIFIFIICTKNKILQSLNYTLDISYLTAKFAMKYYIHLTDNLQVFNRSNIIHCLAHILNTIIKTGNPTQKFYREPNNG